MNVKFNHKKEIFFFTKILSQIIFFSCSVFVAYLYQHYPSLVIMQINVVTDNYTIAALIFWMFELSSERFSDVTYTLGVYLSFSSRKGCLFSYFDELFLFFSLGQFIMILWQAVCVKSSCLSVDVYLQILIWLSCLLISV